MMVDSAVVVVLDEMMSLSGNNLKKEAQTEVMCTSI